LPSMIIPMCRGFGPENSSFLGSVIREFRSPLFLGLFSCRSRRSLR
jgi:hypothetical protein